MQPEKIPDELIDQLLAGREGPEAITGPDGVLKQLTKRVVERAASAELTGHLGYELGEEPPEEQGNRRNGKASKTLLTEHGPVEVELPRDRDVRSSRRSCPSTSAGSPASTTRSSRCMRAVCRR